ncbi:MAG: hypothetical protein V4439_00555 [Patescibacteria group bacterium]
MNFKKLSYVLAFVLMFSCLAFVGSVKADNENNNGNEDSMKHAKEAHDNGSTLEVHIYDNGKVLVRGAKVTGVSGTVVSAYTTWGSVTLNWAVNAGTGSKVIRKYGGVSSVSEVSVGDFISFHGDLVTTAGTPLTVNADTMKDWSIQKKGASLNGMVKSVDAVGMKFVLSNEDRADVTVMVTSSTKIMKGDMVGTFADIVVGAKVSARGVLNTLTNTLTADLVKVNVPKMERTVMGGTIKSLSVTASPMTLVMTSGDKDYTVNFASDTSVLNALWLRVGLSTLRVGDSVQVYGMFNINMTVDATVVRDTSLK